MAKIFFSDIQSVTLNYHTPRLMFISKKSKGGVHLQSAFKLKLTEKIKHSFLSSCKGARKILLSVCFFVKEGGGYQKPKTLFFAFFPTLLAIFDQLCSLFVHFKPYLIQKNIIFSPFRNFFPEKLSRLSVKGGGRGFFGKMIFC